MMVVPFVFLFFLELHFLFMKWLKFAAPFQMGNRWVDKMLTAMWVGGTETQNTMFKFHQWASKEQIL